MPHKLTLLDSVQLSQFVFKYQLCLPSCLAAFPSHVKVHKYFNDTHRHVQHIELQCNVHVTKFFSVIETYASPHHYDVAKHNMCLLLFTLNINFNLLNIASVDEYDYIVNTTSEHISMKALAGAKKFMLKV